MPQLLLALQSPPHRQFHHYPTKRQKAGLFRALEQRARSLQQAAEAAQDSERKKDKIIASLRDDLTPPLANAMKSLNSLLVGEKVRLNSTQKGVLRSTLENLQIASAIVETLTPQE